MLSSTTMTYTIRKLLRVTLLMLLAVPVYGAIQVDTTNETDPAAEFCTLHEAIDTVNGGTDLLNGCGEPSEEIQLAAYAEYRLTQPLPHIEIDVILRGNRSYLVRDRSAPAFRFLEVASGELTLERLNLKGGSVIDKGGAVRVYPGAGLTLMETKFSHNEARRGGAIYSEGELIVADSEFWQNHACQHGGAVVAESGTLLVLRSSFLDNKASWEASCGSSPETTEGGALFLRGLTGFEILSSTFHSLADRGGAIYSASVVANPARISKSTFVTQVPADGSALAVDGGAVTLRHTILQGPGPLCSVAAGEIVSQGFNVAQDASCSLDPLQGDKPLTNPQLTGLGYYGGVTQTYALSCRSDDPSPAVDIYPCSQCEGYTDPADPDVPFECLDQRGQLRPAGHLCDVGAYEAITSSGTIAGTTLTIDILVDYTVPVGEPGIKQFILNDGACHLDRIDLAQADPVDQVVWRTSQPPEGKNQVEVEEIVFFDRATCKHDCFEDPDLCVQDCRVDPPCYLVMPEGPGSGGAYTVQVDLDACATPPSPGDHVHPYVMVFANSVFKAFTDTKTFADTKTSRGRLLRSWRWSWDPELVVCVPPGS